MQCLIVLIFNSRDKSIPSNYMTIMISHILAKLYELILENKISHLLESHDKRAKGKAIFMASLYYRPYCYSYDHYRGMS